MSWIKFCSLHEGEPELTESGNKSERNTQPAQREKVSSVSVSWSVDEQRDD